MGSHCGCVKQSATCGTGKQPEKNVRRAPDLGFLFSIWGQLLHALSIAYKTNHLANNKTNHAHQNLASKENPRQVEISSSSNLCKKKMLSQSPFLCHRNYVSLDLFKSMVLKMTCLVSARLLGFLFKGTPKTCFSSVFNGLQHLLSVILNKKLVNPVLSCVSFCRNCNNFVHTGISSRIFFYHKISEKFWKSSPKKINNPKTATTLHRGILL